MQKIAQDEKMMGGGTVRLNIKTSLIELEGYSIPDMDIDKRSFN